MAVKYDLGSANHHAAIALSRIRWLSLGMRELMRKEGIWEDLIQEMYAAGWQAHNQQLDDSETRRFSARRLNAFLKAYGFHRRRRQNVKLEVPFSRAFNYNINDRGIAPKDKAPLPYYSGDHLDEKILAYIRNHPQGLTRTRIAASFQIMVTEVQRYLTRFKEKGLVSEIKRESVRGRPAGSLFFDAGQTPPSIKAVATERDDKIRHAYFVEKKGIKQIASELHHDKHIVRAAIGDKQRPVICEICGKRLKTTQALRGHKTFAHSNKRSRAKEPVIAK